MMTFAREHPPYCVFFEKYEKNPQKSAFDSKFLPFKSYTIYRCRTTVELFEIFREEVLS